MIVKHVIICEDSHPSQAGYPGQNLQANTSLHPGLSRGRLGDTQNERRCGEGGAWVGGVLQAKAADKQGIPKRSGLAEAESSSHRLCLCLAAFLGDNN